METESVNASHTVTYQYDSDSLVTSVDQASGPDLALLRNAGAGFGAGLLTGTTQGAIATTETPSPFGELASVVATEHSNPLYALDVSARDALGRIETKVETIGAGPATTSVYTYDAAGRLDTVTVDSTLVADYAYDANGNRTHEREDLAGPPIAVYDDQDRLLSYDGTTYTYSAAGDLETSTDASGTTTYGYDALGNLRSVALPDGEQIEYGIDGQNRRVGKKVCPAPCTPPATPQPVQGFLYGDQLRIVAELDGSNDVVSRFVYATRPNVPDFLVKGGVTYRILSDQVGSVRLVVDADTGAVAQRIDYDAFGVVTADTNPGFQPFGFAGGLTDPDTGLVRFGARDYDPRVGRWTSKDPIRFAGGHNLYGYALNSPMNLIDPSGLVFLEYNIRTGVLTVDPQNGNPSYPIPASSGRGAHMNNPSATGVQDHGPIPAGQYTFASSALQQRSSLRSAYTWLKGGGDYGSFFVPLDPYPGTDTQERHGFYLHGGAFAGSAGCIDAGGGFGGNADTSRLVNDILADPDGQVQLIAY